MKNEFLRSVERFVAVAESGSIQRAAKTLNISQPSLTHSVAKIEEGFEIRLFHRSTRGVVLTPAGELLYPRAKAILSEGGMAVREISDLKEGQIGRFHIRAGVSWGYCFMPEIMANLKHSFPELDIHFNIGNTSEAFPQMEAGEIDAIIGQILDHEESLAGIECTELGTIKSVLVCGNAHPLASKQKVSIEDIAGQLFIAYEPDVDMPNSPLAQMAGNSKANIDIAMRTRSPHAALEMVSSGNFLTVLSNPFVQKYKFPSLKILPTDFLNHEMRTGIYFRQTLVLTDPFRQLMRDLRKAARSINLPS
uniref:LysR family transcriptional regulator n=1 Tax=Pararhizobium sp. IMCC3301 TaxID=3067904 RepID=UPI0027407A0C|nr:LysR family transcriptional regulator [Pararhizobium sp. IMCC3301]